MMDQIVAVVALTLIGLCLGSFCATAGLRLARGEQSLFGRSRCDGCGVALSFARTTPVISYVGARGRCTDCGSTIGPSHLVGELLGGGLALTAILFLPVSRALLVVPLGLALLTTAVVDAQVRRLPDALTAVIAALCIGLAAERSMDALITGLASGLTAFLTLWGLKAVFRRFRGVEGLGFGDVKLIGALGIWLGLATPWAVGLAAVMGLVWARFAPAPDRRVAFGPMICAAAFVVGFAREAVT